MPGLVRRRRRVFRCLRRTVRLAVSDADPIHLLIRRHARADQDADEVFSRHDSSDEAKDRANRAAWLALWRLVEDGPPSTLAGVRELCAHVAKYEARDPPVSSVNDYDAERNWRFLVVLLRNVSAAIANIEADISLR